MTTWNLYLECKNSSTQEGSRNVIFHINKMKEKTLQSSQLMQKKKKAIAKIQHIVRINTINKLRIEENYLSIIKTIYEKPITYIILNSERMKAFPLRSNTMKGSQLWCISVTPATRKADIRSITV